MKPCSRRVLRLAAFLLCFPATAFAQRALHWDALEVTAHLDANGHLEVAETHTMVFTGDWNGGERTFNIRPRQKLILRGIYRDNGIGWQPLTQDADLDSVDDYAWIDSRTLRWRSRRRSDPPFNRTTLRYQLRYDLSGILLKENDGYLLDHDFAFPDRAGTISRFELRLTLDPLWQPAQPVRDLYTASNMPPDRSFVLTLPLRYIGTGQPAVLDLSRPPEIRLAVLTIFGAAILIVTWFFLSEQAKGRFDPIEREDRIDESWLRENILKHPAEIVGAAWDNRIGQPEVVALLARMTSEGKLESEASGEGRNASMTLRLHLDRSTFTGYERTLIDALFFDGQSTTSTGDVKEHYKKTGFNPAAVIRKELESSVHAVFPPVDPPRKFRIETMIVFAFGLGALVGAWYRGYMLGPVVYMISLGSLILAGLSTLPGNVFRSRMDWGRRSAVLCLIPAVVVTAAVGYFLWFTAGTGIVEIPAVLLMSIVALAVGVINTSVNSLRSREDRVGIALRKKLTAARAFFVAQLRQSRPALRDDWYPWILAFGLNKQMNDWSARTVYVPGNDGSFSTSSTSSASSANTWTGFAGGHSGGAGGGATWAAAAGGLAAGVASPSSGGGGGGGGGGGSSGGGGGGGW
jgi:predicted membrane protein DUF2207